MYRFAQIPGPRYKVSQQASSFLAVLLVSGFFASLRAATPTTTTIAPHPAASILGRAVTITAAVTPFSATGKVTFYDETAILGSATLTNGSAALSTSGIGFGQRHLTARYVGDANYSPSLSAAVIESVTTAPGGTFLSPSALPPILSQNLVLSLTAADLNHDGFPDLIATDENYPAFNTGTINVYLNNGNGTFAAPVPYLPLDSATQVAVGDVDLDGNPDLVVSVSGIDYNTVPGGVFLLKGRGDGTFPVDSVIQLATAGGTVRIADLNSDGFPDLVITDNISTPPETILQRVSVLLGNGDGTFRSLPDFQTATPLTDLVVGDFNHDGIPDLAISSQTAQSVSIFYGNGDGTFGTPTEYAAGSGSALAVADVNHDGIIDLIAGNSTGSSVFPGNANGVLNQAINSQGGAKSNGSIVMVDVDGDGNADIISDFGVSFGNGDGTFRGAVSFPSNGYITAVADFNGDGIPDVVSTTNQFTPPAGISISNGALAPVLTLSVSANTVTVGQPVNVTITSNRTDATGTLTVFDQPLFQGSTTSGTTVLLNGSGTYQTQVMRGGNVLWATYSGDSKYSATRTAQITVQGEQTGPSVTLTVSPNPVLVGQAITLTATFSQNITGNYQIEFFDGATPLGYETVYGTTTTLTTTLAPGSHRLRVEVPPFYGLITPPAVPVVVQVNAAPGGQLNPGQVFEGQSPGAMVAGDFNGDGLTDLAIANTAAHIISIFSGTNKGVPGGPVTIPLGFAPGGLALGPVIVSGINTSTSLLVTDPVDNSLTEISDSSVSGPSLLASFPVGMRPAAVASADFNNDGFADFITANAASNDVSLVLSAGNTGGLFPAVSLPAGLHPDAILVADFNNDGNADFAVANRDDNNLMVFTGNGDGTFRPPVTIAGLPGPVALAAADLNGDGKTDLAVADGQSGQVTILLGNGNGTFNTFATYQAGSGLTGIAATYFGTAASPSLAVTTSSGLLIFPGNGDGTFNTPMSYPQYAGAASLAVGSFDADHRMEIAVSVPATNSVAFVYNDVSTSAVLTPSPASVAAGTLVTLTVAITPATASGVVTFYDGVTVLGSTGLSGGQAALSTRLLTPGQHSLSARFEAGPGFASSLAPAIGFTVTPVASAGLTAPSQQVLAYQPGALVSADFNHDGIQDFAYGGNGVTTLLGNGTGAFTAVTAGALDGTPMLAADFNGDGIVDIMSITTGVGAPSLSVGAGNGIFTPQFTSVAPVSDLGAAAAIADVNRDGLVDLIMTNPNGSVDVVLGHGDGTFRPPLNFPLSAAASSVAAADINGDGIPDVVTVSSSSDTAGVLTVAIGDGNGGFTTQPTTIAAGPVSVVAADFDGDHHMDVAVAHSPGNSISVLLGNGNGIFGPPTTIPLSGTPVQLLTDDINGDGNADLIVMFATGTPAFAVLYGNGNGTFQSPVTFNDAGIPDAIATADVNRDGRRDVVLATSAPSLDVFYGATSALSVNQGAGQSAASGSAFAVPLKVNAPAGVTVTFSSPASGPGGTFAGWGATATVFADASGIATAPIFTAGNIVGSYNVMVSAPRFAVSTSIPLTNTAGPPAFINAQPLGVLPTATVNTAFAPSSFQALVQDAHNNPVPNTPVTFSAAVGNSGASLTFTSSGTNTATVNTNASGIAIAPQAMANSTVGSYGVTATATPTSVSTQYFTQNIAQSRFMIEISPTGSSVLVDGVSYNGQFNYFNWTPGDTRTLSVSSPQQVTVNTQNVFTGWSDGGAPLHTIIVPQGVASIKASFKQQIYLILNANPGGTISPSTGFFDAGPLLITATPNPGYAFSGWEGELHGNTSQQTLNLTQAGSVTADFASKLPLLAASLTRAGPLALGERGAAYSITVGNSGLPSTVGTVTTTEHLPAGLTLVSMSGIGWACAGTVCSRSDALSARQRYDPITVSVNVAINAPSPITNQITVSGGGSSPATASDTTIPGAAQSISFGAISSVTLGIAPFAVNATATSGLAVSFSSGTPTVCTVAGTAVTIVAGGICSVIANQPGNGTYGAADAVTQSFLVNPATQIITFHLPATPPVNYNLGVPLTATSSSGLQVFYSTTTQLVCFLNVPNVYFQATGACTITAYQTGNASYLPASLTVTVVVGNSQVINFSPITDVPAGTTTAALVATSSSFLPVSFGSNTPAVCLVSGNTATVVASGTCSITATQAGNATYGAAPLVVRSFRFIGSATSLTLASSANPIKFGGAVTLTANVVPASTTGMVTFYDGTTILGTRPVSSGYATLTTLLLTSGTRTLKAVYDDNSIAPATLTEGVTAVPGRGFQPAASYGTQLDPFTVAVGDFNGDGTADIAVSTQGSVSVRLGNGDGTFAAEAIYHIGSVAKAVAVGDFNGDGKPDLAVTGAQDTFGSAGSVSILLGNGNGTFQQAVPFSTGGPPGAVVVADFTGDGIADLAVSNDSVAILPGKGDGTFGAPIAVTSAVTPVSLAVADFNGDGKADLVLTPNDSDNENVVVLLGKGDGTFNNAVNYFAGETFLASLAVGDFNGDGSPDVAVVSGNGANHPGTVSVLLGRGDGTFLSATTYPTSNVGATQPMALVAADFNGDGKTDLAVTCQTTSGVDQANVTVFLNNGTGNFQQPARYNVGPNPDFVAVGDFNNDGVIDLITTNYRDSTISVLLGKATQPATVTTLVSSSNPVVYGQSVVLTATVSPSSATGSVAFYDGVTALGTKRLTGGLAILNTALLASGTRSITAAYLGDSTHSGSSSAMLTETVTTLPENGFQTAITYPGVGDAGSIAMADFNGDGIPDLVVPADNGLSSSVRVFPGNGDGTFQAPESYIVGAPPQSLVTGDFNGDGFVDLVAGNMFGTSLSLLFGNGDGTFQASRAIPGYQATTVAAGDFNGDGILDLVFGSYPGTGVVVLLGNGDGTFQSLGNYSVGDQPAAIAVGDFNGDGKPDLAVAIQNAGAAVLLGYGDGTFQTAVHYSTGGPAWSIIAADLDGDGKLDLAVTGGAAGGVAVLPGLANGSFGAPRSFAAGGLSATVAAGDFDGDGHADLAAANPAALNVSVLPGDGSLNFGAAANHGAGNSPEALVAGDFNGDGRTDLAIADAHGGGLTILLGTSAGRPQTISFGTLSNLTFGSAPFSLAAMATSGLPVNFVSSTPGVCTVSGATATVNAIGTCSVTARQPGSTTFAAAPPITRSFNVTVTASAPPTVDSVSPVSGAGISQVFTFSYSSVNGSSYLSTVYSLFNSSLNAAGGCYVYYAAGSNALYLYNDAGTSASGALTPGSTGTLSNSQCTLNGSGSSATVSSNTLSLVLSISFKPGFIGLQNIYGYAIDNGGNASGWETLGAWRGSTLSTPPTVDSVSPATGSGSSQIFTLKYSTVNGTSYLSTVYSLFNSSLNAAGGCYVYYAAASNAFYLYNDAGTSSAGALTPGSSGTLSNSQCTLNGSGSSASSSGNTLSLALSITFQPAFVGLQNIYGYAIDGGGSVSGWQTLGAWRGSTVSTAPTVDSVSPATGSGSSQIFTFKYSSVNGSSYLSTVYSLFNGSLNAAGGCYVYYAAASNALYLYNDAGASTAGPLTPGSGGTLSNSQCTLNGTGSSATGSGNTLSLALSITFKPAFAGLQNIYGYAIDSGSHASGWQTLGAWRGSTLLSTPPTADSVSPASGSGSSQIFTLKYSSVNGSGYLSTVYNLINGSLNAVGGCYVSYIAASNALYLYNDAGTSTTGPLTPGSGGTLTNSQCTLNGTGSSASGSGNTLSLALSISFKAAFSGLQNIYGYAIDSGGHASGWQTLGTWRGSTLLSTPPTADSVTPASGAGSSQVFTFKYSSVNGNAYLNTVYNLINGSLNAAGGCYVSYTAASNALYLYNDAGTSTTGPLTPGSGGSLTNSQCTLNGTGSSASGSGNTLSLALSINFKPGFAGPENIYGYAIDSGGYPSGWHTLGAWNSAGPSTPPTADSVSPASGSGSTQVFTFNYSSVNGSAYLSTVYNLINGSLNAAGGCYVYYVAASNALYLYNDAGTSAAGPLTPGSAGTFSNSQCTLNGTGSSATGSGNTLSLALSITFKPAFAGLQNIYGYAIDSGGHASGWQTLGSWRGSTLLSTAPTADSVSPASGSGTSQIFTFKYSSVNGSSYLSTVYNLINGSLNAAGGCYVSYIAASNALYLYNDAGTSTAGPLTPGSGGTLSNSKCTLNGIGSSTSGSGNTLSVSLSITFKPAFTGTQNIYGYATDNGGNASGWHTLGVWNSAAN